MVLTYEQRVELLKKAREAKKNKKLAKQASVAETVDEEPTPVPVVPAVPAVPAPVPKNTRVKKVKEADGRTLEIKEPQLMPEFVDSDPEVEEQIIYKPKEKKKKKIIRKIIMEASSEDEEVEVIEERVKAPKKVREHAPERPSVPPEISTNTKSQFFNF